MYNVRVFYVHKFDNGHIYGQTDLGMCSLQVNKERVHHFFKNPFCER